MNVGVFFFHLKETEKIEKPNDDKRPINKPNKVPTCTCSNKIKTLEELKAVVKNYAI